MEAPAAWPSAPASAPAAEAAAAVLDQSWRRVKGEAMEEAMVVIQPCLRACGARAESWACGRAWMVVAERRERRRGEERCILVIVRGGDGGGGDDEICGMGFRMVIRKGCVG